MSRDPLRFFAFGHLPRPLRDVSREFHGLAKWMVDNLPPSAERSAGLRKLLEAKDCAVRARVDESGVGHHSKGN